MTYPPFNPELPVCIDFDGVLVQCTYPSPALGPSIQEGIDLLLDYYDQGAEIVILTSRPESHWPRIWRWLDEQGLTGTVYDITNLKVRAGLYVDDKAVRFPIQMNLSNDEVEVPCVQEDLERILQAPPEVWGDVPYMPPGMTDDTEPTGEGRVTQAELDLQKAHQDAAYERHPSSERFHQILEELGDLHDEKSLGYGTDSDPLANVRGSSEWGIPAWQGAMIRAQDKIRRLQSYAVRGELPFEAVEDAFNDLAVYAVIGRVLFEQEQNVRP